MIGAHMALSIYRRHTKKCTHQYPQYDRTGKDCRCMIHVEGQLGSDYLRETTNTRAWSQAVAQLKKAERSGVWESVQPVPESSTSGKSIAEAVDEYLADCESVQGRHLSQPTMVKYRTVLLGLVNYCTEHGYTTLDQITFTILQGYRRSWKTKGRATENNINRLRNFFDFSVKSGYAEKNVAQELEMPRESAPPERLPYTEAEMSRILKTARTMKLDVQQPITNFELETFCLVQRYAGLAIADASLLRVTELRGDEIRYYRKKLVRSKRKQLVVVPIPPSLVVRLKALPLQQGKYFFCHGSDKLTTAVEAWRVRLQALFVEAKIENGGSHRLRHTFATSLLSLRGKDKVSIELVSRWLGHASIKVTEKHYSHYLEDRIQSANDVLRDIYKSA